MAIDLSTPSTLDWEALLQPIGEENPAGRSLSYEPEYDQIREARRSEEDIPQGAWERETKVADWDEVVDLTVSALRSKTKDLQIAAWLTEALTKLHGFAGFRDGVRILLGIQETYWESYFPEIDDGDLESRVGPFLFLNRPDSLPRLLRSIPVTTGDEIYNIHKYQESRETENLIRKNPEDEKKLLSEGRIRAEHFDRAVAATGRRFYERIVADLHEARDVLNAFEKSTDERFGRDAPSLMDLRKAIDECVRVLDPILAEKRIREPITELDNPPKDDAETVSTGSESEPIPDLEPSRTTSGAMGTSSAAGAAGVDFGSLLIEFQQRAEELATAGVRLKENRARHSELLDQLRALDQEYEEISRQVSRNREFYDILQKLLRSGGSG